MKIEFIKRRLTGKSISGTIPLPPIVGGIALVGGIVLLVVGKNKS